MHSLKDIQLVQLDPAIDASLIEDPAYLNAMVAENWEEVAHLVHQRVGRKLKFDPVSIDELVWDGYLVVDTQSREVVGCCAFKGPPTEEGTVEIAYFTFPEFNRQGYATSMAHRLIELATACLQIKRVIAHTLPEASASTRVLEKVDMRFVGEVVDPDDGPVWQWERQIKNNDV